MKATIAAGFVALSMLSACAPLVWNKAGADQAEFSRVRYDCIQASQQRVSGASVNAFGGVATNQVVTNSGVFEACMNADGWYLGASPNQQYSAPSPAAPLARAAKPVEKSNQEKLQELSAQINAEMAAMCASVEFAAITAKSPCRTSELTPAQLSDKRRLDTSEKSAFIKLTDGRRMAQKRMIAAVDIWGQIISVPWSAALEKNSSGNLKNASNLLSGSATWGHFNTRRQELSAEYRQEYARLTAPK